MSLNFLDDTLNVDVFYEKNDQEFCDNICLRFWESCPDEERLFIHDETNIYLTPEQARAFAQALLDAAEQSEMNCS